MENKKEYRSNIAEGEIIIYQAEDGHTKIDVKFVDETVWLTQTQLCELYQTSKSNISEHIKHIFEEEELEERLVVRKFRTTASDGKNYNVTYYNLDMIISLGYRIKSKIATNFRRWATERLKEYMLKGFTMDDERLKSLGAVGISKSFLNELGIFVPQKRYFTDRFWKYMQQVLTMIQRQIFLFSFLRRFRIKSTMQFMDKLQQR